MMLVRLLQWCDAWEEFWWTRCGVIIKLIAAIVLLYVSISITYGWLLLAISESWSFMPWLMALTGGILTVISLFGGICSFYLVFNTDYRLVNRIAALHQRRTYARWMLRPWD